MTNRTDWKARAMELADAFASETADFWSESGGSQGDIEAARAALRDHLDTLPSHEVPAEPVAWGIFDSQGFYEAALDEESAKRFCDHYTKRGGPLAPFTYQPLYLTPPPPMSQEPAAPQEAEPVRKDAERYRWLRDTNHSQEVRGTGHLEPMQVERIYFGRPEAEWTLGDFAFAPVGEEFDIAIDAAMSPPSPQEPTP